MLRRPRHALGIGEVVLDLGPGFHESSDPVPAITRPPVSFVQHVFGRREDGQVAIDRPVAAQVSAVGASNRGASKGHRHRARLAQLTKPDGVRYVGHGFDESCTIFGAIVAQRLVAGDPGEGLEERRRCPLSGLYFLLSTMVASSSSSCSLKRIVVDLAKYPLSELMCGFRRPAARATVDGPPEPDASA